MSQCATMGETGLIIIAITVFQALATASEEWGSTSMTLVPHSTPTAMPALTATQLALII